MFGLFRKKTLTEALASTKKVKVKGVLFEIRKLGLFDYLNGSKVLLSSYDLYQTGGVKSETSKNKLLEHYTDVFMAGVVKPVLTRKENGIGIQVNDIFKDSDIAMGLYKAIIELAYGKKKVFSIFQGKK